MNALLLRFNGFQYLREMWQFRYFVLSLVRIDLRNRYKRSVLGVGWTMLHPIAMTTVLCTCFHVIFKIPLAEYVPFLMTGMAFWGFFSASVTEGCQSFYQAQGFIKAERVPLALFPLRTILGAMIHLSVTLGISILSVALFKGFTDLLPMISLIPTYLLLLIFGWSLSLLMAFVAAHFPDILHLSSVGLQMLYYLTPVMYPPSIVASRGLGDILRRNPLGYFLDLLRDPIVNNVFPSAFAYATAAAFTVGMLALALFVLRACERRLIFALL